MSNQSSQHTNTAHCANAVLARSQGQSGKVQGKMNVGGLKVMRCTRNKHVLSRWERGDDDERVGCFGREKHARRSHKNENTHTHTHTHRALYHCCVAEGVFSEAREVVESDAVAEDASLDDEFRVKQCSSTL